MRYVVLTTPTCSRSNVLKQIAEDHGLDGLLEFADFRSERGVELLDKYKLDSGIIFDLESEVTVSIQDLFKSK